MLAYNLLSQNLGSNSPSGNATPIASPPVVVDDNKTQVDTPEEPPKTMAERLVEAIYLQANEFNALKKKTNTASLPTLIPSSNTLDDSETLTAFDLLSGQQRSHAHASRQQRLLLPDAAPRGLDAITILQEREKHIERRALEQLTKLASTTEQQRQPLGYLLNEYYDDTVRTASPERLRSIVQLRSLQLRDKQTKVRAFVFFKKIIDYNVVY
jgi:ATP-dependent helicase STH1/SNF2